MNDDAKSLLLVAKAISSELESLTLPPEEGTVPITNLVLSRALVKNSRGYIEKVVHQINGTYEHGWYDACAVMIRRLVETLIIEAFESHKLDSKIKNGNGDFFFLGDLINATLNEKSWNIGRNAKKALPQLKDVGDLSAHNRRYIANRSDIEKVIPHLRIVVQELFFLTGYDKK